MSTPAQSIGALVVTCEKCGSRVRESEMVIVVIPNSYGVEGSPDEYIEMCNDCDRKEVDDLPF
jgi:hypothetical protein